MKPQSIQDIITDILAAQGGFWNKRLTREGRDVEVAKAKQALYEAVVGCVPGKLELSGTQPRAYNACRREVLTNLRDLFGISKEGEDL